MPDNGIFSSSDQSTTTNVTPNDNTSSSGDPTTGPVATLVGEGRKYRSIDDLAKAYLSADEFLERIKGENAELREQLNKAKTIDDVLERLKTDTSSTSTDHDVTTSPSGLSAKDVQRIVSETISSAEGTRTRDGNLQKADAEMRKVFGDKAGEVFAKEAATPQMRKALMDLAAVSPEKFVALFAPARTGNTSVESGSSVNSAALNGGNATGREGDSSCKEYYDSLRRKEPAKYYSQAFQLQMNKAATSNPDKFFGR
ncbi:hypothetical protein UFOVP1528_40 [uncultured Caudovirales phage]|uniref:Uncharacterized protein n=1 Tax=uncultured Caudovirales phage TaxID=2100421 RepID=A0A6J5SE59_9CAUD|nr:hypothetical protein UFOVP905_35 [uncultured Caudovirales phage]CAB4182813.1 hypothetical protein UFOVP1080_23 [uncultured Caudovirales phage]CAB4197256.1 hypothetical protein UFOVP1321_11 [uncultured Caudovirales phage]CAB4212296.1 hypothetical protein UFOVP1432_4 [uncultured Caudovirales phage]CAB5227453.1 hypothetical protein UFOVP1528_40 [uncultured Caudovirales phage]